MRAHSALLIINDHLHVAVETNADGVHLGQEDSDPAHARARLRPHQLIGLSTHTRDQVLHARLHADYIGFGPVFGTTTKDTGFAPRGADALRQAVALSAVPVIAIGGITPDNLGQVRAAGAHGWAVISAIHAADDPAAAARGMLE